MTIDKKQVESLLKKYGHSSLDYYKLWDKRYLDLGNDAIAAYGTAYGAMIILEDPIGPSDRLDQQINVVIKIAKTQRKSLAFLEVGTKNIAHYHKKGFVVIKIGEIVRINVSHFLAKTIKDKNLHYKRNRAAREGYHFQVLKPPLPDKQYTVLKKISDDWLSRRNRHEQGFATGYFDPNYIRSTSSYVLLDKRDKIIAFTTKTPSYKSGELIIDVVRYLPGLANGAIEYLVMCVIEMAAQEGYKLLNMGVTPLSGIDESPSNVYEKLMAFYYRHFSWPLNVVGLHTFKSQFDPELESCYIVCQKGTFNLIRIGLATSRLLAVKTLDKTNDK